MSGCGEDISDIVVKFAFLYFHCCMAVEDNRLVIFWVVVVVFLLFLNFAFLLSSCVPHLFI